MRTTLQQKLSRCFKTAGLGMTLVYFSAVEKNATAAPPPPPANTNPAAAKIPTRKSTDYIVIHCSDTRADVDIGATDIRRWHTSPDPGDSSKPWADIGYHYVIRRDGTLEKGRERDAVGAHAKGYNDRSVSVCLVGGKGGDNFTAAQYATLKKTVETLQRIYPKAAVIGHCAVNKGKTCPSFDVPAWTAKNLSPAQR